MNKTIQQTLTIGFMLCIFLLSCHSVSAQDDSLGGPNLTPGTGGGRSVIRIILDVFFGGKGANVDIPDEEESPTPTDDPSVTVTPGETTPIPTTNVTPPTGLGLNPGYNFPADYVTLSEGCLPNKGVYQQTQEETGVPWQVMGGIHFVEGSCGAQKSCVSGRQIGTREPDVGENCSPEDSGIGKPNPLSTGGCGFTNLLDSCVYGANHLKGKIGKAPQNLQELAKALGRYNGTGNANCGRTPFTGCPPPYEGYDHIYPFSKFDDAHQTMYLVYCADGVRCNPPRLFTRIGVLTIASILSRY